MNCSVFLFNWLSTHIKGLRVYKIRNVLFIRSLESLYDEHGGGMFCERRFKFVHLIAPKAAANVRALSIWICNKRNDFYDWKFWSFWNSETCLSWTEQIISLRCLEPVLIMNKTHSLKKVFFSGRPLIFSVTFP